MEFVNDLYVEYINGTLHSLTQEIVDGYSKFAIVFLQVYPKEEINAFLLVLNALANKLPVFDHHSPKIVAIAAICLHVLFYNFIAKLEFKTKLFTKIFGSLAFYLNVVALISSALIRDHYIRVAVEGDAFSKVFLSKEYAEPTGNLLMFFGVFLNLWTLSALGVKGMYNGDSFGYLMPAPVTSGPYMYFTDPQYVGTTFFWLGHAVFNQSKMGYGLTGVMYIVFQASVVFIEGPHMNDVYSKKKKQKSLKKNN